MATSGDNTRPEVNEDTESPDIVGAYRAISDAQESAKQTARLVEEANRALRTITAWRNDNHFTPKIRDIIQGAPR